MASLFKQRGTYVLQFYDENRSPGRKKIPLRVTRKRDAERLEQRLTTAYAEGRFDPWTDDPRTFRATDERTPDLREAMSLFLDEKEQQGRSPNTIRTYKGNFRRLLECIGDHPLDLLTAELLNQYIRTDDVSSTTQHKRYRHISALLNWCVDADILTKNPLDKQSVPKRKERLPKTMYREDLKAICQEVREDYTDKLNAGLCDEGEVIWRERTFRFAFYTGLRGSEIGRLRWKHLDRERSLIYILEQKNGKQQTIPLHEKAATILEEIPPEGGNSYVFGGPGTRDSSRNVDCFRNNLSRAFRKYRVEAGIERPISLHSLRHGFCTALAEAGKSAATIKELARHASIETSMIYVKMSNEHLKSEMEDVF